MFVTVAKPPLVSVMAFREFAMEAQPVAVGLAGTVSF
jgi:hypothetical protein